MGETHDRRAQRHLRAGRGDVRDARPASRRSPAPACRRSWREVITEEPAARSTQRANGAAARRSGGAARAREAAGRPLRHGGGVWRGARGGRERQGESGARAAAEPRGRGDAPLALAAAAVLIATAAFFGGRMFGGAADDPLGAIGRITQVTWEPGLEATPALSPDGKTVVYAASDGTRADSTRAAWPAAGPRRSPTTVRRWSTSRSGRPMARIMYLRTAAGAVQPFSVEAVGGTPRPEMAPRPGIIMAAWSPDGAQMAFATYDSLFVREAAAPCASWPRPTR